MGAPKQKWREEEEAALKAGVAKYGAGKWSTILKDPEFSTILRLRSNVDLKVWNFDSICCILSYPKYDILHSFFLRQKLIYWWIICGYGQDKWRNLNVLASGFGSRQKARVASKNNQLIPKNDENSMALSTELSSDIEIVDAKPLATSIGMLEIAGSKKPISRLHYFFSSDNVLFILELLFLWLWHNLEKLFLIWHSTTKIVIYGTGVGQLYLIITKF